jgi:DNA polymerase-3 subunit gamma/tau
MRQALEYQRHRLEAGDVLRMLRLLADSETAIRRSANPRLIVETLLLRWTMMDRTVDLAQVLGAGSAPRPGSGGSPAARPTGQPRPMPAPSVGLAGPSAPPARGAAATGPARSARPSSEVQAAPTAVLDRIPAELEAVRGTWSELVAEVRAQSRFLGEALAATTPSSLEPPWLTVELAESNPLFAERLQAQARAVEDVLERSLGQPVRLRVVEAAAATGAAAGVPRKLTEATLKADRLRGIRSKDPSLDTAADALDLEIVD